MRIIHDHIDKEEDGDMGGYHLSRVFHNHIGVDSRRVVLRISTENFSFSRKGKHYTFF